MRAIHDRSFDIDRILEDAARAKQELDAERWREELRPRTLRLLAARTTKLAWSRALLKLVVHELYPDDLFSELIGNLDRVPRRRWPQVIAVAVALRRSWRRDGLTQLARSLRITTASSLVRKHPPKKSAARTPHHPPKLRRTK